MTTAVLTPTLDEELEALLAGESDQCLVCGEHVEVEAGRAECPSCRSTLEPSPEVAPGQLALA